MTPPYVWMTVPRVVAELLGLSAPVRPTEVPPMAHDDQSAVMRQREMTFDWLCSEIHRNPSAWGEVPDPRQLAARLLELRHRVRSCQIEEAREVAAL